uniref:NADP-dependent oxidoreductase domain-containing protein n=1 Tax=Glossina austeni TaxID=7395 RepID=A0A1A9V3P7_GLOAU
MQFMRSGGRVSVWWFVECKNNFQKNLTKSFSPRAYSKIEIINDMRLNYMKNLLIKPCQQQLVCNRKAFCATVKSHRLLEKSCEYTGWQGIRNKRIITEHNLRKGKQFHIKGIKNNNQENFNKAKMDPKLAPTVKLNSGYDMPVLGLGTYQLKKGKCEHIVREAIKIGYRHIDTAYLYGNESNIGKVLKECFDENLINRSELFLVTKLWSTFHESHLVRRACKKQMEALNVNYIDLYLMHSPISIKYVNDDDLKPHNRNNELETSDVDFVDTYKAMEKLVEIGWVRSLGVSNFDIDQLERLLDNCSIKPVTNQVECHPGLSQRALREYARHNDIIITAYSPLGRPKSVIPYFYEESALEAIAAKYNKTKFQIVLKYLIGINTVPIPKTSHVKRLVENIDIFDFNLNEEEIASKGEDAEMAVKHAIDVGYRHIDTAYFYENEAEVGKAIKEKICAGVVKREDIFLVTKLWNIHHEPQRVKGAFLKQLETIGLDYIDLYLMHLPVGYKFVDEETLLPRDQDDKLQLTDVDYLDTYKAMEELVKSGLVRSIGVSNFNSEQLQRILDNCCIKPVTNQVECSPALNQRKLTTFCKERDIILTAYSPLGRPNLTTKTPEFYFSPKTESLAKKYQKTPAQIILRYLVDIGTVPIPKSANQKRIEENFNIFDFKLTANDIEIMDSFNTGDRLVPFNLIKAQNHKYFPFHIEF